MLIITMTSWKKRIQNIPTVLDSIFNQSMLPDKIVINLSVEEFLNKENDLPKSVLYYIKKHKIIEIYWVEGKNTKQWKKIIPTMYRYPNDWIICIDDDMIYWKTFISDLWKKHLEYPNNPITINEGHKVNGFLQHCGCGTLEKALFYKNFNGINLEELYNFSSSDTFYNYMLHKNGYELIYCGSGMSKLKEFNSVDPLSKIEQTSNQNTQNIFWKFLEKKYGKINNKNIINVNIEKQLTSNNKSELLSVMGYNTSNIQSKNKIIRKFK